jgi:CheY-like chemotaxis protein
MNLELEIAEDGRLACEMAEKSRVEGKPFDLILMDIQMPKMNGYEATRWLRQHGWKGPIVALTAHGLVGDREKCLEAGCDDYIAKPVTAKGLRDVLARYLGQAAPAAACPRGAPETAPESAGLLQSGILDPSKVSADRCISRRVAPAGRTDRQGFSTAQSQSAIRIGAPAQRISRHLRL